MIKKIIKTEKIQKETEKAANEAAIEAIKQIFSRYISKKSTNCYELP